MEINSTSRIHHPVDRVFEAYRDKMPDVAAFVPDVKEILVHSREDGDGVVKLHNEWVSDRDVPAVAAKVIKPEHLRWDDFATWHTDGTFCEWTIKTRAFTENVTCSGTTKLVADGDGTKVVLKGDLNIDLKGGIPGVPGFVAKRLAPQIEKFIVALVKPNLERTNEAIGRYLDSKA